MAVKPMTFDEVITEAARSSFKTKAKETVQKPESKSVGIKTVNWSYGGKTIKIFEEGELLNGFMFSQNQIKIGSHILNVLNSGKIDNILALGGAGTGKTSYIKRLCENFNIPVFYMNCAVFRDPTEWFGERTLENGNTNFKNSPLANFMISDEAGVIILDELNRTDEFTRGVLLSLFDDTRSISIQDNVFDVGKGKVFYATANQGYGYTGTHSFDLAEFRRFKYLDFVDLTEEQEIDILVSNGANEKIANDIVKTMKRILNKLKSSGTLDEVNFNFNVSKSLQVLDFVKSGLTVQDGFLFAVLHGIPSHIRASVTTIINGGY